jgi:hypothetical protein
LQDRCEFPVREIALLRRQRAIFCTVVVVLTGQRANELDFGP